MSARRLASLVGALALIVAAVSPVAATTAHNGFLALSNGSPYSIGSAPLSMVTADFNSDGNQDWASASVGNSTITVMLGDGSGGFTAAPGSPITLSSAARMQVGLVDAGSVPDLVVVSDQPTTNDDTLYTFLGTGTGGFAAPLGPTVLGPKVGPLQVGDLTGDGKLDVVFTRVDVGLDTHSHLLSVLVGSGTGTWSAGTTVTESGPLANPESLSPISVDLGDMDGDGDLDVVLPNRAPAYSVSVWLNNGTGVLTRAAGSPVPVGTNTWDMATGDINGDGYRDVLLAHPDSPNSSVLVMLGNGAGGLTLATPIAVSGMPSYLLERADFNADGAIDFAVVSNVFSSQSYFKTYLGDGAGGFTLGWGGTYSTSAVNTTAVVAAAFTTSGLSDLAMANNTTTKVNVYLSTIDDTPPTVTVTLEPPTPPESGWYVGDVYPLLSVTDSGSGVATYRCAMDPGFVPATYDQVPNFCVSPTVSTSGVHHYYVAGLDRAGNKSGVVATAIPIDRDAPVVTIETATPISGFGWYAAPLDVSVSANDFGLSGVAELRCATDPGVAPLSYDDLPAGPCSAPTGLGEGQHDVYAAARDVAGNTSSVQVQSFDIDVTAPTVSPTVEPATFIQGDEPTWSAGAIDTLSGIDPSLTECDPIDQALGEHTMTCTATDKAGNQAAGQTSYTVLPPPDAAVTLTAAKAAGARLALKATVHTNADLDVGTISIGVPSSLRPDSASAGCTITGLTITCPIGAMVTGSSRQVTVLVSPRTPGPHQLSASIQVQDTEPDNDAVTAPVAVSVVCDNVPTSAANTIVGTSGADILCGLGGNDTFRGLGGDDLIFGGTGVDTISYAGAPGTWIDLRQQGLGLIGAKARSGTGHGRDSFTGIENALGSAFADLITGSSLVNRLVGGDGADLLSGLGGADRLEGGAGQDSLIGGAGTDTLVGGPGTDRCRESTDAKVGCEL